MAGRPRSLRLRVSERRLILILVDLLIVNVALLVAQSFRPDLDGPLVALLEPYKWYVSLTVVWLLCGSFFLIYDLARAARTSVILPAASGAVIATVLIYSFIPSVTPPLVARKLVFAFLALAWAGIVVWRVAYAQLFVQPWFRQRALVIGAGWAGRTLAQEIQATAIGATSYRGTGYELVGFVDDDPAFTGASIGSVPVLGGHQVLVAMAEALAVDEIILAITHRHAIENDLFDALLRCRELGMRVTSMSAVYERLFSRVPVQHVGRDLDMAFPAHDHPTERLYANVRRLLDIFSGLVGLLVLAVLAPLVALVNAFTSPGPLLYAQARTGRAGKTFNMIKFRSMIPDAEKETGAVWADDHDPRITVAGRFLRSTRLDELPQVINILRGEMSLIGPRPERPEFVEDLAREIPFYRARHAMRPGITGWAQVRYRYGNSVDDSRVKLEYDLYYIKNANVFLDLRIILETIPVMIQFKGK